MCLSCAGRVVEIDAERHLAVVESEGAHHTVSLAVLALEGAVVSPGDWVLLHTGFAMEILDPHVAAEMVAFHRQVRATDETGRAHPTRGGTR